jgi:hypothetical protein
MCCSGQRRWPQKAHPQCDKHDPACPADRHAVDDRLHSKTAAEDGLASEQTGVKAFEQAKTVSRFASALIGAHFAMVHTG